MIVTRRRSRRAGLGLTASNGGTYETPAWYGAHPWVTAVASNPYFAPPPPPPPPPPTAPTVIIAPPRQSAEYFDPSIGSTTGDGPVPGFNPTQNFVDPSYFAQFVPAAPIPYQETKTTYYNSTKAGYFGNIKGPSYITAGIPGGGSTGNDSAGNNGAGGGYVAGSSGGYSGDVVITAPANHGREPAADYWNTYTPGWGFLIPTAQAPLWLYDSWVGVPYTGPAAAPPPPIAPTVTITTPPPSGSYFAPAPPPPIAPPPPVMTPSTYFSTAPVETLSTYAPPAAAAPYAAPAGNYAYSASDAAAAFIKQKEGFTAVPKLDPNTGKYEIGYGTEVSSAAAQQYINGITQDQAQALLDSKMSQIEDTINNYVDAPLTQNQFDALTSLIYNVGAGSFTKSQLLQDINAGNFQGAAQEFLNGWNTINGVYSAGLAARRGAEYNLFTTPGPGAVSGGATASPAYFGYGVDYSGGSSAAPGTYGPIAPVTIPTVTPVDNGGPAIGDYGPPQYYLYSFDPSTPLATVPTDLPDNPPIGNYGPLQYYTGGGGYSGGGAKGPAGGNPSGGGPHPGAGSSPGGGSSGTPPTRTRRPGGPVVITRPGPGTKTGPAKTPGGGSTPGKYSGGTYNRNQYGGGYSGTYGAGGGAAGGYQAPPTPHSMTRDLTWIGLGAAALLVLSRQK